MDNELGYIITATRINHSIKDVDVVALAEDAYSGGYCYWTQNLYGAKKFSSIESAKKYKNPSFKDSLGKHKEIGGLIEIRTPCKIQKVKIELESIMEFATK